MHEKILIVEDEPIVAAALVDILEELNYNPLEPVSSGEDALDQIPDLKPDLILMDIVLDGELNGINTADRILKDYNLPVIFITAYSYKDIVERAVKTEPYGYILKPVTNGNEIQPVIELALVNHAKRKKLKDEVKKLENIKNILDHDQTTRINLPTSFSLSDSLSIDNLDLEYKDFLSILSIVGNHERFKILNSIRKEPLDITPIKEKIEKSSSTISHHLHLLLDTKFLIGWRDGKFTKYSFNREMIQNFTKFLKYWISKLYTADQVSIEAPFNKPEHSLLENFFLALSNTDRVHIIEILAHNPSKITDLQHFLEQPQSTIYYHLKILDEYNLIHKIIKGKFTEYSLSFSLMNIIKVWSTWVNSITNWFDTL